MKTALPLAAALLVAGTAHAAGPPRFIAGDPKAAIALGVVVPAGSDLFLASGVQGTEAAGNTEAQTLEVLHKLVALLSSNGYAPTDVVNVKVHLVGDPKLDGRMDFPGMNAAFRKVFPGPDKPSRTTVQVAGLATPGSLVEIDLTAAKPAPR